MERDHFDHKNDVIAMLEQGADWFHESRVRGLIEHVAYLESRSIDMLLWCPSCGSRHIDEDKFATTSHHTHACQKCGMVWRPAVDPTRGVRFLPGFKNGLEKL
jgi:predicted RNA-binding Zn-ribbon protein involved in translation (DUF1610 family)